MTTDLGTKASPRIEELGPATCLRLIELEPVGRIVFLDGLQPLALPVTFTLDVGAVVFQSGKGSKLEKAMTEPGARVAFEVDRYDPEARTGWSVLIKGTVHPILGLVDAVRIDRFADTAWADVGDDARWVRIEADEITGRRVGPPTVEKENSWTASS